MSKLNKVIKADTFVPFKVKDEPRCYMLEIINAEKQLWSLIYSKGILHKDARDLYIHVCSGYEKIILNDHEEAEFQEVEYSLWKLHYKNIHEFRKGISQSSTSSEHTESVTGGHVQRYKSFLMEASEFYQNLISKTRKLYGLGQDPLLEEKGGVPCDPVKLHKCQYLCHRFLVCLGDLARYEELCKSINVQRHNWSVAATYYFKAASTWPDSGNPQNQLAVLAKYIGDDFLALYHCIRSLAVKEPFPDAWNNLILLLEENRSSNLESLSREALFNFSKPFERSASPVQSSSSDRKYHERQTNDCTSSAKTSFWSLFVRMISLFFVEASPEDFPYTFTSTTRELEFLLALNDIKLRGALESYQHMDSDRIGPYRALQLVSIIIFVVDSLTTRFHHKESKDNTSLQQPDLVKSALTATFIILTRLTERCLKDTFVKSSPLLPAVLVFVEWLIGALDIIPRYVFQEEVACAVSYFLDTFVQLLNHLKAGGEFKHQKDIALWEDIELRGFAPLACSHKVINFRTREEPRGEFVDGNTRGQRIVDAAVKIAKKSPTCLPKWIFYDTEREKFFTADEPSSVDLDLKEPQTLCETFKEKEKIKIETMEEEEEIIFNPLARYNSAPIYSPDKETSPKDIEDKTVPSDDSLRRAASLFVGKIQNSHPDSKNFKRSHPLLTHETALKASATPYPLGPPSLNDWVLDKESINTQKEKAAMDFFKPRLTPIHEMCSLSLIDSPLYSPPIQSVPGLPNDASLFCENSATHHTNSLCDVDVSPMISTSTYKNRPALYGPSSYTPMSSSEWLQQFRSQNRNRGYNLVQPIHCYTPGNVYSHDVSRLGHIDKRGVNPSNPNQTGYPNMSKLYADSQLGFVTDGLRRDNLFHNYQMLSTYESGVDMSEIKAEQPSFLQYLKEKEWQLQNQARMRGPAYMGN